MAMDTTFSDDEKRFLLAEMIKVSQTNVDALIQFVRTHATGYKFWSIVVPQGRNLEQCVQAAENMLEIEMPRSSLERSSVSTISGGSPTKRSAMHATVSASTPPVTEAAIVTVPMPPLTTHAPFSPLASALRGSHVPIKPRPVPATDVQPIVLAPNPTEGPPVKKRRGRPPRRPIDYSLPTVAPKPIAPHIAHPGGLLINQHPFASAAAPFLSTSTPPAEGSLPGTPIHTSTPSGHAPVAPGSGTPGSVRGRKRSRQPETGSVGADAGEETPSSESGLPPSTTTQTESRRALLPRLQSPPSPHTNHTNSELRNAKAAMEHAAASVPRYTPTTDDGSVSIPSRGPTLAPLTARGEPSLQPSSNPTKRDRPTPVSP